MIKNLQRLGINTTILALIGLILIAPPNLSFLFTWRFLFGTNLTIYLLWPILVGIISTIALIFGIIAKRHNVPYGNLGLFLSILDLIFLTQFIIGNLYIYPHIIAP